MRIAQLNRRRRAHASIRRGMSVIVVLGLVVVALAMSYVMVRSESTGIRIQANGSLQASARDAARTGIAVALKKMYRREWAGVSTPLHGAITTRTAYDVTFTTGDTTLSGDLSLWPYRVTIHSIGSASDAASAQPPTTYTMDAVVQLLPRAMGNNPSGWSNLQNYSYYQWDDRDLSLDLPCRLEGMVYTPGKIKLCKAYPGDDDIASNYLADLNRMRLAGQPDYRTFTGPVQFPTAKSSAVVKSQITAMLGATAQDVPSVIGLSFAHPGSITTYRLYPGGATYTALSLGSELASTTISADPKTNPLGLLVCSGDLTIRDDVTLKGTLIVTGDLMLAGAQIVLQPANQPALDGTTSPVCAPTAVVGGDVTVLSLTKATVQGVLVSWGEIRVVPGSQNTVFSVTGRAIAEQLTFGARTEWDVGAPAWESYWYGYVFQLGWSSSVRIAYFPRFLEAWLALPPVPNLTIKPSPTSLTAAWMADQPLFTYAASDAGLQWDLISIRENR